MKSSKLKFFLSFLLLTGAPALAVEKIVQSTEPIHIEADYLEFQETNNTIYAQGNVRITQGDTRMSADQVVIRTDTQMAQAAGHAVVVSPEAQIKGESLRYDFKTRTGSVSQDVILRSPPTVFHAQSMVKLSEDTYRLKKTAFTSCDEIPPHYHATARTATLVMGKEFRATNVVFYLGQVPLLYLPFFRKDLDTLYTLEVDPGYGQSQGYSLRTTHGYPLTSHVYGKALVDYMSRRGWGTGAEVDYNNPDKARGTLYGYHIKERDTFRERWNLRGDHWMRLTPQITTQATGRFQSDTSFNNEFLKSALERVDQDLQSSAAMVYQNRTITSRLLYQYDQVFDPVRQDYVTEVRKAPEAQVTTTALRIPGTRAVATANASFGNQFLLADGFRRPVGSAGFDVNRDFRLTRKMTFKPSAGFTENYSGRVSQTDDTDEYTAHYRAGWNLRRRVTRTVNVDVTQNYQRRLVVNGFRDDSGNLDRGVELNRLGLNGHWRPSSLLRLRTFTGYDLRQNRGETIEDYRQKWEPVGAEVQAALARQASLFGMVNYKLYEHEVSLAMADAVLYLPAASSVSLGFSYNGDISDRLKWKNGVSLPLGKNFHLEGLTRYELVRSGGLNLRALQFIDKEINVRRDFHDFIGRFRYLERAGERQVTIRVDFRTDALKRTQNLQTDVEKEFYPWRSPGQIGDR